MREAEKNIINIYFAESTMVQLNRRKYIIDCDTGVDDAVAICMALDTPDIDLLAITVVHGNCVLDQAVDNTLKTLKLSQKAVSEFSH